jgi:putative membrane protein insertion efficiency factor
MTLSRTTARFLIRAYQVTLSSLIGRQCRYFPSCAEYTDEAIALHGVWAGGWMGTARICRCHPWGGSGLDPVPERLPPDSSWYRPWRYGRRRPFVCEEAEPAKPHNP